MKVFLFVFFGGIFLVLFIVYIQTKHEQEKAMQTQIKKTHLQTQLFYLQNIQIGAKQAFEGYNIITQSTNLETVKGRYDYILRALENTLSLFDRLDIQHDVKEDKLTLENLQKTLIEDKDKLIKQSIYNAFQAEMMAISKLKTTTEKIKRQDKFYERACSIFPEQESYIRDLIEYDVFANKHERGHGSVTDVFPYAIYLNTDTRMVSTSL